MQVIWPLLHPDALDQTFDQWLLAAVPLIQAQRSTSSRLAANYLTIFKTLEVGANDLVPKLSETADADALTTSLLVTGPLSIKRALARMVPLGTAVDVAQASSSASGMRYALNGGRETVVNTVNADRDARGWTRVISGKACEFCSMLEGRGAVYTEASADFQAHDGCTCGAEPAY